jgi:N-acyl-D-aspartate/D-glutamate deacylase
MDALGRTSLKQAQWLEPIAPAFGNKGRLQVGKDADIVVFNPQTIAAGADYQAPYAPPIGMSWVVVNGEVVVSEGQLISQRHPGKRLLGSGDRPQPL